MIPRFEIAAEPDLRLMGRLFVKDGVRKPESVERAFYRID
jgi:hypothetical protein